MNEKQIGFLKSKNINPFMDLADIEEEVSDYYVLHCLNEYGEPNAEGILCESILDYIAKQ